MKCLLAVALAAVCILPDGWAARKKQAEQPKSDRAVWAETAYKIAAPVLADLAAAAGKENIRQKAKTVMDRLRSISWIRFAVPLQALRSM